MIVYLMVSRNLGLVASATNVFPATITIIVLFVNRFATEITVYGFLLFRLFCHIHLNFLIVFMT